jgi:WD40 repeat protein
LACTIGKFPVTLGRMRLTADLVDRVLARHPVPIADATAALVASASVHELRDRVVECFRAVMRVCGAIALAARAQFGAGPSERAEDSAEIMPLLRALRRRGLTDGQWVALCRGLLRPWADAPGAHPLPGLVALFHGPGKTRLARVVDGLLEMRKSETVAHGATGGTGAIEAVLERRMPQLEALLEMFDPLWESARLVVPADTPRADPHGDSGNDNGGDGAAGDAGGGAAGDAGGGAAGDAGGGAAGDAGGDAAGSGAQAALLLMGDTPGRDRWRRVDLAPGSALEPGQPVIVDERGRPRLALHPIAMVRRPSPEASHELFLLDGARRRRAVYVAFPSMAEHYEPGAWAALDQTLTGAHQDSEHAGDQAAKRPYRGLRSFDREHADLFFGRDREIETLANRIRGHGMVTVTGPSGSGKSSLLRAGVLPSLGGFEAVIMRPGATPLDVLARRVEAVLGADATRALLDAPEALVPLCAQKGVRLIVCVDQTEELFTLCGDAARRHAFARALAAMGTDADAPTRVVLSIRGDFFARLATLPALAGLYSRQVEVSTTPGADALVQIVSEPARQFGYEFEDAELIRAMIEPLAGEPAALAMLQFCADRLWDLRDRRWKRLTWDAYEAIGGVEGALAAHADAVVDGFAASQRRAARALFMRLVTAEGTRAVVRQGELLDAAGSEARGVLDALVEARLLVVREDETGADEATVEIIHEALLARWDRLREWLDDDREYLRIRDRVAAQAAHWIRERAAADYLLAKGKPLTEAEALLNERLDILQPSEIEYIRASQRRRGRLRLWARMAVLAVVAVASVAALAGVHAWREGQRASREGQRASREAAERASAQDRALRAGFLAQRSEDQARESRAEAAARANDAVLARARADLDRDPTASLAWLELLDSGVEAQRDRVAAEARLIAADARARGIARAVLPAHQSGITAMVVSADGQGFATAGEDGAILWWGMATGASGATGAHRALPGHRGEVLDLALSPDGAHLASAGADGSVHVIALGGGGGGGGGDGDVDGADRAAGPALRRLDVAGARVERVAFSPAGNYLATGGRDGAVLLWDLGALDAPLQSFEGMSDPVTDLVWTPDGIWLAAASAGSVIWAWNLATGEPVELLGHALQVSAVAASPRGALLASVARDRTVRLWNLTTGQSRVLGSHELEATSVAFSPDGARVVSAGMDGNVRVWPVESGEPLILRGHGEPVSAALFTPDSARVVSAGTDKTVRVWDLATGQGRVLPGHGGRVTALAVTAESEVISAGRDGVVRIWPVAGDVRVLSGHSDTVSAVALSLRGDRLATAGRDGSVRWLGLADALADALADRSIGGKASPSPVHTGAQGGHQGQVHHLAFSPGKDALASAGEDGTVRIWNLATGAHRVLADHGGAVWHVAFSPDGARVVAASDANIARIWHVNSRRHRDLGGHTRAVVHVAFSADGARVATASWDGTARLWDSGTGKLLVVLGGHGDAVTRVAFSPDGARVATASWDGVARLFDIAVERGGEPALAPSVELRGHTAEIHDLVFGPDGVHLATAGADRTVRVWRIAGQPGPGPEVRVLRGHDDEVISLVFLDRRRLASASSDHTVRLWDLAAQGGGRVLAGHGGEVNQVIASSDGALIISASDDRTVRVWRDDLPFELDALKEWARQATSARWSLDGQLESVME